MATARLDLRPYFNAIVSHPARLFWAFAIVHGFFWVIIPALTCPNAPLDVIENYAWGREWLMGTHKHPPMQAWWLEIFAQLTGRAPWAHYLASQAAVLIAFWAVWDTGRRMMGERAALIGVLLLEGVLYYNFTSPEFNANILQLPFWALAVRSFYRAVKDNRLADWLLLGLWSAGGLYSKYSTVLLLVTLIILMLARPEVRRRLRGAGPYLAIGTMALLFMPHMIWLVQHDFMPFTYAQSRMNHPHHKLSLLLGLVSGQLGALLPAALLFFSCFNRNTSAEDELHAFDRAFLCIVTFGPFFLTFLFALAMGYHIRDMWGTPFWNFIGLWAIFRFRPKFSRESLQRFAFGWGIIFIGILFAYGGSTLYGPYVTHKTQRAHFPGRALAEKMADAWHERYHRPLKYVIGDIWPAGNVAYYASERPHVFMMGDYTISPWIDSADLKREGGIIVWCVRYCIGRGVNEQPPPFIHEEFPQADVQPWLTLPRQTGADVEPVIMAWAFLPPGGKK